MKKQGFFAGIPTNLDVKRLREAWPFDKMKVGEIILYEDVEKILGIPKDSHRFKTVTLTWRRKALKETPFVIGTERGVGFKILNDSETANLSGDKLKYAAKSMRSSIFFAARVNTRNLNSEEHSLLKLNSERASKALATLQIQSTTTLPDITDYNRTHKIQNQRSI